MLLRDVTLKDVPQGHLVHPSSAARRNGKGGYAALGENAPTPDSHLFPALILDPIYKQRKDYVRALTPTGVRFIPAWSIVSVER